MEDKRQQDSELRNRSAKKAKTVRDTLPNLNTNPEPQGLYAQLLGKYQVEHKDIKEDKSKKYGCGSNHNLHNKKIAHRKLRKSELTTLHCDGAENQKPLQVQNTRIKGERATLKRYSFTNMYTQSDCEQASCRYRQACSPVLCQ